MARLKERQVISRFAFGFPTLPGYPPPAPVMRTPMPPRHRAPRAPFPPPPVRSRSYRALHDCLYLPDFEIVEQFVAARRRIAAADRRGRFDFEGPLCIGLLLTFFPPVGVTLLWASKRFTNAAKVAVTGYAAFATLVVAAVILRV